MHEITHHVLTRIKQRWMHRGGSSTSTLDRGHARVIERLVREAPAASVKPPDTVRRNVCRRLREFETMNEPYHAGVEQFSTRLRAAASLAFACTLVFVVTVGFTIQRAPHDPVQMTATQAQTTSTAAQWLQRMFNESATMRDEQIQDPLTLEVQALLRDARDAHAFVVQQIPFASRLAHQERQSHGRSPGSSREMVQ